MTEQLKNDLEIIKESVLQAVPATAIYLFGSHAYGEPNDNSDLGIYVVVPEKDMCDRETRANIISNYHKNSSTSVDLLLRDKNTFEYRIGAPTLERKIHREGIKVYG